MFVKLFSLDLWFVLFYVGRRVFKSAKMCDISFRLQLLTGSVDYFGQLSTFRRLHPLQIFG
jgi:hypothetical protein